MTAASYGRFLRGVEQRVRCQLDFQAAFLEVGTGSSSEPVDRRWNQAPGRLIDVREGPNVRLSFDGFKVKTGIDSWQIDGFAMPPDFDNSFFGKCNHSVGFWGVYGVRSLKKIPHIRYFLSWHRSKSRPHSIEVLPTNDDSASERADPLVPCDDKRRHCRTHLPSTRCGPLRGPAPNADRFSQINRIAKPRAPEPPALWACMVTRPVGRKILTLTCRLLPAIFDFFY